MTRACQVWCARVCMADWVKGRCRAGDGAQHPCGTRTHCHNTPVLCCLVHQLIKCRVQVVCKLNLCHCGIALAGSTDAKAYDTLWGSRQQAARGGLGHTYSTQLDATTLPSAPCHTCQHPSHTHSHECDDAPPPHPPHTHTYLLREGRVEDTSPAKALQQAHSAAKYTSKCYILAEYEHSDGVRGIPQVRAQVKLCNWQ